MEMIRLLMIVAAALLATACTPMNLYGVPPTPPEIPDREPTAELDALSLQMAMLPGHAIVRGQAFSRTVGGDVKYGAGSEILVLPNVDYVSQCIGILKMQYIRTDCGKTIYPMGRVVIADGEGRFEITNLSPGDYSISTLITWGIPGRFGIEQTGGVISTVVSVETDTDVITVNVN